MTRKLLFIRRIIQKIILIIEAGRIVDICGKVTDASLIFGNPSNETVKIAGAPEFPNGLFLSTYRNPSTVLICLSYQ